MTYREFVDQIGILQSTLCINRTEFVILSGGSLLLRGIRSTTRDLDVSIRADAANRGNISRFPLNHKGLYMITENCEAGCDFENWSFDIVNGYQCQTLESILECKRKWQRAKDVEDITLIEAYLSNK